MTLITFIFVNSYGDSLDNYALGITITSSNDIIIVGQDVSNGSIIKMDLNGNIKWVKKVGGTLTLGDVIESSDGKYIIVGQESQNLLYVSKIDTNGSKIWEKNIALYQSPFYGVRIEKLKDGNYLVVDYYGGLLIIDENGNVIKTRQETSISYMTFYNGLARLEGGYLIVGRSTNFYGMFIVYGDFSLDYLVRTDQPTTSIYPYFLVQDNDSSYLIGGSTGSKGFIIKLDKSINPFQVKWAKTYNEINNINFISRISDGNYVAFGNYKATGDSAQIVIFKFDSLGNVLSSKIFKSFHNKYIRSAVYRSGYFYIISDFKGVNNWDLLLIRANENFSDICGLQNHNLTSMDFQLNRQSVSHSYYTGNTIFTPSTSITNLNYNSNNFCAVNLFEFCDDELRILIDGYNLKIISKQKDNFYKIYDISGNFIMKGYLKEGFTNIRLNKKGIYILKLKKKSYKFIDLDTLYKTAIITGTSSEVINDLELDKEGNVFAVGTVTSTFAEFSENKKIYGSSSLEDVFVVKLSNNLDKLYKTAVLGSSFYDYGSSIVIDENNEIFVSGITYNAYDFAINRIYYGEVGNADVFISKLSNDLDTLYNTAIISSKGKESNVFGIEIINSDLVVAFSSDNYKNVGGNVKKLFCNNGGLYDVLVAYISKSLDSLNKIVVLTGNGDDDGCYYRGKCLSKFRGEIFVVFSISKVIDISNYSVGNIYGNGNYYIGLFSSSCLKRRERP